jgi:hypothetical protein
VVFSPRRVETGDLNFKSTTLSAVPYRLFIAASSGFKNDATAAHQGSGSVRLATPE